MWRVRRDKRMIHWPPSDLLGHCCGDLPRDFLFSPLPTWSDSKPIARRAARAASAHKTPTGSAVNSNHDLNASFIARTRLTLMLTSSRGVVILLRLRQQIFGGKHPSFLVFAIRDGHRPRSIITAQKPTHKTCVLYWAH